MENWKVKEVSNEPEKSQAEIERELVEKAEAKMEQDSKSNSTEEKQNEKIDEVSSDQEVPVAETTPIPQIDEEQVLSFLKSRYENKEINSLDDLVNPNNSTELPQEVSDFLYYRDKTGGTFDDFKKLTRNVDEEKDDVILRDHLKETQPFLDDEDIEFQIKTKYGFDETLDSDDEIRAKKISKKKGVLEAREFFKNRAKEFLSVESTEKKKPAKKEKETSESTNTDEIAEKQSKWFSKKTDEYFNSKFNGFKFKINDNDVYYSSGEKETVKDNHSNFHNFLNMHLNEDGYLKDAEKYHKSLAAAFNPDAFAKFFYEKGQADAISADVKEAKNVDMGYRKTPVTSEKGKFKVTDASNSRSGSSLLIKSNRNK